MSTKKILRTITTSLLLVVLVVIVAWLGLSILCTDSQEGFCIRADRYYIITLLAVGAVVIELVFLVRAQLHRTVIRTTLVRPIDKQESNVNVLMNSVKDSLSWIVWDNSPTDSNLIPVDINDFTHYYFPVKMDDESTEFVPYKLYYTWLNRVISLQNTYERLDDWRRVPFGQNQWINNGLAGHKINRRLYEAMVYLLRMSGAMTPNRRRLRVTNTNDIIRATEEFLQPVRR